MKQIHSAVIIGLKWFDRANGNTYHVSRIYINNRDTVFNSPVEYGYGTAYMDTAAETAIKNGYSRDDMSRHDLREWLSHNAIVEEMHVTKTELKKAGERL